MAEQAAVVKGGSSTEQWLDATLDQVFLSPRVIDERSYEELAGSLRALMKDAAGQSRALIATTGEVKLLGDQLRDATQQLQAKVETAVRVIPTLDQRVAKAEALLEVTGKELAAKVGQMQDAAARAVPIERERIAVQLRSEAARLFDEIVREHLTTLRGQLEGELEAAKKRAEEQASAIVALIQGAQAELEKSIAGFEERSWAATSRVEKDLARLEETLARVESAAARAEAGASAAHTAQSALESTVTEAGVRLGAGLSEAERRAEAITMETTSCIADLITHVNEAKRLTATRPSLPDDETLKRLGAWLQQLITQGDQIGRGLSTLIRRAEQDAGGKPRA